MFVLSDDKETIMNIREDERARQMQRHQMGSNIMRMLAGGMVSQSVRSEADATRRKQIQMAELSVGERRDYAVKSAINTSSAYEAPHVPDQYEM
jgi:hypothetical protein